jgi:hypothetical protein
MKTSKDASCKEVAEFREVTESCRVAELMD